MCTTAMWRHLMNNGVTFEKVANGTWLSYYAGAIAARDWRLGDLVWKTAEALGEV